MCYRNSVHLHRATYNKSYSLIHKRHKRRKKHHASLIGRLPPAVEVAVGTGLAAPAFFPLVTLVTFVASFSPRFARRFFLSSLSSLSPLLFRHASLGVFSSRHSRCFFFASLRSAFFSVLFSASLRSASMRFSRRKPRAMSPMGIMSPMSPMGKTHKTTQDESKNAERSEAERKPRSGDP